MNAIRSALGVIFFGVCTAALAQSPGAGETRPVAPEKKSAPAETQRPAADAERELKRCEELSGTLREDCLRDQRAAEGKATAGATQRPEPPTAPPPQNPR